MAKNKKAKKQSKKVTLKIVKKASPKKQIVAKAKSQKKPVKKVAKPKPVVMASIKVEKKQEEPVVQTPVILTDSEVLAKLHRWIPKIVYNTTSRYATGPLHAIFNEADMIALAEDTSLEVLRRVKIGFQDSNHNDAVDLRGCEAYYKTAFKNQCLKLYEKYAKTDIRAGIQTIGSEEAMAVAASKNLYSPEDGYVLADQMSFITDDLDKSDAEYNGMIQGYAARSNREVKPTELQFFREIFNRLLDGYTAEEIETQLQITNADFLRQKRLLFEFIKQNYPTVLNDMSEHFESQTDMRVHVRDVNKRQKLKQAIRDFKPKPMFYIHTKVDKETNKFVATLYARIEMYDRFDNKSNKVPPKLLKMKEITGENLQVEMNQIKDEIIESIPLYAWNDVKRVVFTIETNGEIMGYMARDITGSQDPKTLNSKGNFRSHNFWNYDTVKDNETIIIAEGIFSAIKCGPEITIALLGKVATNGQIALLRTTKAKKIIFALDADTEEDQKKLYEQLSVYYPGKIFQVHFPSTVIDKKGFSEDAIKIVNDKFKLNIKRLNQTELTIPPKDKKVIKQFIKAGKMLVLPTEPSELVKFINKLEYKDAGDYSFEEMNKLIEDAKPYKRL